jgi:single-stranded DNA-specific DHH superfamily exonuclease
MSIETAAKDLASELVRHEQVEILCHHDADGIAAGAIMSIALYRARVPFRLRVIPRLNTDNLPKGRDLLLCDLGSGLDDLPEETMVIDHHLPLFEGPFHVNPRLADIDGDRELSAAGTAFLVANAIGDNRDLAGLVLTGIIGDGQELTGRNQEIFHEGIANGIIGKNRGIRLPGRDITEQLTLAASPYLPGISGKETEAADLISRCTAGEEKPALDLLLSSLVLGAAGFNRHEALLDLYGDRYQLEREVIEDAHTMSMVIDACGKEGEGSIAAAICLRSSQELDSAWDIARSHRMKLIHELETALDRQGSEGVFEISDRRLTSDIADTISRCMDRKEGPVIVVARQDDGNCHLSVRLTGDPASGRKTDLGTVVHTLAAECGGHGGGHTFRAGAMVSCDHLTRFITGIQGEYA